MNPPAKALRLVEDINKNLLTSEGKARGTVVLYLLEDGRYERDWRCRLLDADGNALASYLQWEHLKWHTVAMFLNGFEEQAKANVEKGKRLALEALHQHQKQLLGLK